MSIYTEECQLVLPIRPPDPADARLPAFAPPEAAPHSEWTPLGESRFERRSDRDEPTGDLVSSMRSGYDAQGRVVLGRHAAVGMDGGDGMVIETRIHPSDPLRARAAIAQRTELQRGAWSVAVESEVEISATRDAFRVAARLAASEAGQLVFERRWDERVPRAGI